MLGQPFATSLDCGVYGSGTGGQALPFDWAYGNVDHRGQKSGMDVWAAQQLAHKVVQDEEDDKAGLKGGVGRLGGGGGGGMEGIDGDDGLCGGHPRCQERCSCALTGSGLGQETDRVAWKGASGASSGIRQTLLCAVACRVCATWVRTGS